MCDIDKMVGGRPAWVRIESVAVKLPSGAGFQENGFIASFGFNDEGRIGCYINQGNPHVIFRTRIEAEEAAFAELKRQFGN